MEDEQSTAPIDTDITPVVEEPATDPILASLSDTEDEVATPVVETPKEEEPEAETTPEVEQPPEEEEDLQPEIDPKEIARRAYEERQRYKEERNQRIQINGEEYVKNAEDEYDQRLRTMEVERYQEQVEANENKLVNEFERAKANPDLQIFNPENKDAFNPNAYAKAIKDFNAGYIDYDPSGNITGVKGSLFEHLTETAELLRGAQKSGAVQQVRASREMRSNADPKPAATPKETQKDAILDILKSDD